MSGIKITGKNGTYGVVRRVAEYPHARVYLVKRDEDDKQFLLQAAATPEHNSALARAAFLCGEIVARSARVEVEYAALPGSKGPLNYHLHFPIVEESFLHETDEGNQQMVVVGFHGTEDPNQMVPVRHFIEVDKLRTDLRSTVWVVGKALKALQFSHDSLISLGMTDAGNLLIGPNKHYVVYFDLTMAELRTEPVPRSVRTEEIIEVAKAAIDLSAGNAETGEFPDTEDGRLQPYVDFLIELANGEYHDAHIAHVRHYEIADSLWEYGVFHPFTFFPR